MNSRKTEFEVYLRRIGRHVPLRRGAEILDVGCGTGWFSILCSERGFKCTGLDIDPKQLGCARAEARARGADVDFVAGCVEESDLGTDRYDVAFASSVFEHVRDWKRGVRNVHRALRPGGLLYFYSTNRFSPKSGEARFPLYGLLPVPLRRLLKKREAGPGVPEHHFDFNQFTHAGLRRFFREVGFRTILDQFAAIDGGPLVDPAPWKRAALRLAGVRAFRGLALWFSSGTLFVCVK